MIKILKAWLTKNNQSYNANEYSAEVTINKNLYLSDIISEMIKDEVYLLNGYGALNNYESFYKASLYIVDKEDLIKKFKILMNIAIANNMVFKSINVKPILSDSQNMDNAIVLKKAI